MENHLKPFGDENHELPGKKEKMRGKLSGAEKDDLRSLEKKLEKRLNTGYRDWSCKHCSVKSVTIVT